MCSSILGFLLGSFLGFRMCSLFPNVLIVSLFSECARPLAHFFALFRSCFHILAIAVTKRSLTQAICCDTLRRRRSTQSKWKGGVFFRSRGVPTSDCHTRFYMRLSHSLLRATVTLASFKARGHVSCLEKSKCGCRSPRGHWRRLSVVIRYEGDDQHRANEREGVFFHSRGVPASDCHTRFYMWLSHSLLWATVTLTSF